MFFTCVFQGKIHLSPSQQRFLRHLQTAKDALLESCARLLTQGRRGIVVALAPGEAPESALSVPNIEVKDCGVCFWVFFIRVVRGGDPEATVLF